ncbi:MAG TPA: hypothetical protein ENK54_08715 [Thiotrichales bacterium]|nr:hypothetical protein [Thiotrichales bacterium]
MSGILPDRVDALRFAQERVEMQGEIALSRLSRLVTQLRGEGEALVRLRFGVDERGQSFVTGELEAAVELTCQRCLQPVSVPLEVDFRLGMVKDDAQARGLDEGYEPVLLQGPTLSLHEIVEDELLLALPPVPRHPTGECPAGEGTLRFGELPEPDEETDNPFAVLRGLKGRGEGG